MLYDECIEDLSHVVVNRVTFGILFEEYPTKMLRILILIIGMHQYQDLASPSHVYCSALLWITLQFFKTHLYIATLCISSSNLYTHAMHKIYFPLEVRNVQPHRQNPKQQIN